MHVDLQGYRNALLFFLSRKGVGGQMQKLNLGSLRFVFKFKTKCTRFNKNDLSNFLITIYTKFARLLFLYYFYLKLK